MKKDKLIQGLLGTLVFLLLLYLYFNKETYAYYDWTETYEKESKSPYGNFMIYELLKNYSGASNFEVIEEPLGITLSDSSLTNTNYIFKGLNNYFTYDDTQVLSEYVARGNNAFVLSNDDVFDLIYEMSQSIDGTILSYEDSVMIIGMVESGSILMDSSAFKFIVNWKLTNYNWNYIEFWLESEDEIPEELTVLGRYQNGNINFIQVAHGDGFFYYHTTPIVFSNYFLKEESGLAYAEKVFAFLDGQKIFWDDFSHEPNNLKTQEQNNPLAYVLSQPPLRWAWYLILCIGLIYLLFYTRIRERVIPVLPVNTNTSIEFVETIASLYLQPNGNLKIMRHRRKQFLEYIRNHYFVSTNVVDHDFLKTVSLKSGIEKERIEQIIKEGDRLEFIANVSDEQLIAFHRQTEYFYNNCK